MPTITVKNIPPELYELLKQAAVVSRRSINSQIITLIERGVRSQPLDPEALLTRARALRRLTERHPIDEAALRDAKELGRP